MIIDKTITTIFMVPTLKVPKDALKNNGFLNGYIRDVNRDTVYPDSICLLFKPRDLDRFREFLDNEYDRTKSIIEDYDYPNGFVVVVYKLDPHFKLDFQKIRNGKYSKTSSEFQNLFHSKVKIFLNGKNQEQLSLQYRIFNKTQDMIDFWEEKIGMKLFDNQEVWDTFNEEKELLDINKIAEDENVKK